MNGVIGMVELLLDTDLSPIQREFAVTIQGSADTLLAVINDILDFSKIEAGKCELEHIDFDLRDVVEDVAAMLAERAQHKGLELLYGIDSGTPEGVIGDPMRLRQILLNLVGNAVKFTERGHVAVRVAMASSPDPSDSAVQTDAHIRVEVSDTGIGIPAAALDRLFRSFSQVDGSPTRRFGGTGLGLAICKQLVERMGGAIGVESVPNAGSVFWFTAVLGRSQKPLEVSIDHRELSGRQALIVDDNDINRTLLLRLCAEWGIECEVACDGHQALGILQHRAYRASLPDIVLLDMQMPDIDGLEVARIIRQDRTYDQLKIVMLSSIGDLTRSQAESVVTAALQKPIRRNSLLRCLVAVVGGEPSVSFSDVPSEPPTMQPAGFPGHVLIAEDNLVNQKVARALVTRLGYLVDVVVNGAEAVRAVRERHYDAILMDCQMPDMDGYAATQAIRRMEIGVRETPIIAVTAHALEGDREKALAAGMDDYVPKPIQTAQLAEALRRWVGQSESRKAA
jgi:two-component system sensor histidine kinase/response regulator